MKEVAFAILLALAFHYAVYSLADNRQVYYVTLPYEIKSGQAVKVVGADRIDALSRIGATVWSEQEWRKFDMDKKVPKVLDGMRGFSRED